MAANVDASRALDQLEAVLHAGRELNRCLDAIDILRRWRWDRDLDAASRKRAAGLVREFAWLYGYDCDRRGPTTRHPGSPHPNKGELYGRG